MFLQGTKERLQFGERASVISLISDNVALQIMALTPVFVQVNVF